MKRLIIIGTILFVFTSCSKKNFRFSDRAWRTLSSTEFSIKYPPTYSLDTSGTMGSAFILKSPLNPITDSFSENINLMVQDLGKTGTSLESYVEQTKKQIETWLEGQEILTSKMASEGYYELIYKGHYSKYNLQWKQHIWLQNNKFYVLTATCEQHAYDAYIKELNKIMDRFKLN